MYISKTKNSIQSGFTLVELMIVIAVISIIYFLAVPAYTDSQARSRITEALAVSSEAQLRLVQANVRTQADLDNFFANWNAQLGGAGASSKYVRSVLFNGADELVITLNEVNVGTININSNRLLRVPYTTSNGNLVTIRQAINQGNPPQLIRWSCVSLSSVYSQQTEGLPAPANLGTLPVDLAPSECR